ncbi:hypothetical protein ACOJBM_41300 [Rhizobium beringeri]
MFGEKAGLGADLVVQTAFRRQRQTTFFIASEDDFHRHAAKISAEERVKIMKRINRSQRDSGGLHRPPARSSAHL